MSRFFGTLAAAARSSRCRSARCRGRPQQAPAQGGRGIQSNLEHPVLPIGSPLPDFSLPGVDGKTHKASEYAGTKLLAIVREQSLPGVAAL